MHTKSAIVLLLISCGFFWQAAIAGGAKNLYYRQIGQDKAKGYNNIGLTYSIELERDGQTALVDSRHTFLAGDQLRFHVQSNIDGYLYILMKEGSKGNSALLFPAPGSDETNFVKAGKDVLVPGKGVLEFDDVPGQETLKLVLSTQRLKGDPDKFARSILIKPKHGTESVSANCLIEFALKDAETPRFTKEKPQNFMNEPAVTVVSTEPAKPLSLELVLQHGRSPLAKPLETAKADTGRSTPNKVETSLSPRLAPHAVSGSDLVADKWAVVVGISEFKNPKWNLMYPAKDAQDFADFLVKEGNFAPDHVKVLLNANATRENILTALGSKWLPANAKPGDLVVVYFASHGTSAAQDVAGKNFLLAYDTNPQNAFATGIELQDLARTIKRRINSERIVIVLDTCHSGAAEPGAKALFPPHAFSFDELIQGCGQLVIASASENQIAHDSLRYKNGIFTKHFIDGMRKNKRLTDVFEYTRKKVDEESKRDFQQNQQPVLKDAEWKGSAVVLVAPPAKARPAKH